jgi:predicted phage terminase large subunit-like protein
VQPATPQLSPAEAFPQIFQDPAIRAQIRKTLKGFGLLYFSHHLYLPPGEFHPEMVDTLGDQLIEFLEIIGFRGCSKSTWGSLILPIFAALEQPQDYPFIIPVSDTGDQASINIANIKHELETNQLLLQDYGTFQTRGTDDPVPEPSFESDEQWQARNLLLSNDVRILARSRGQKIRGLKHRLYRPRLVIIDDPESIDWVRFKENRDFTENWLNSEVIPGLDKQKRKLVILINNLHMDALAARVKAKGTFKVLEYPLINERDEWTSCIWKAQYPNQAALDAERRRVGAVAWEREYKLKVVAEDDQIIKPEDIHYYDELPMQELKDSQGNTQKDAEGKPVRAPLLAALKGHGIDLAISQSANADFTTDVEGDVFYQNDAPKIFILPDPFNQRVTFHEFMQYVRAVPSQRKGAHLFFVEDVAYQKAAIQEMERAMLPVIPMKPTTDKRSRLQVVAPYIKNGTVLFPRSGCEELLGQIFNFGVESHDDLMDGLTTLIQGLVNQGLDLPKVHWIDA